MLSTLTNAGSRIASSAMLYHYTCWTNQQKEATSTIDIGFHFVAADSAGNPADLDHDGLPDYREDANGDGIFNAGDIADWTVSDTDYDGVNDGREVADGTNPLNPDDAHALNLGLWRFDNTNSWIGDGGQLPVGCTNVCCASGGMTNSVLIDNATSALLGYRECETNGLSNINCRRCERQFSSPGLWKILRVLVENPPKPIKWRTVPTAISPASPTRSVARPLSIFTQTESISRKSVRRRRPHRWARQLIRQWLSSARTTPSTGPHRTPMRRDKPIVCSGIL